MSLSGTRLMWGVVIGSVALHASACVKHLPPAPAPAAVAPAVDTTAPLQPGYGRIVVDVVDGPTQVQLVRMQAQPIDDRGRVQFIEAPQLLCQGTPCVTDPLMGNVLLGFPVIGNPDGMEVELVHVGAQPTVYRRALSRYDAKPKGAMFVLGIIAASLGGSAAVTGVVLLPIGLADDSDGLTVAGGITLGAGALLLAAGIWSIRLESDSYRPGSAIHFALP